MQVQLFGRISGPSSRRLYSVLSSNNNNNTLSTRNPLNSISRPSQRKTSLNEGTMTFSLRRLTYRVSWMTIAIRVHLVKCRYLGSLLLRTLMTIHHWAAIVLMKMMIEGEICCKIPGSVVSRTPMPSHYRKNSRNPAINHRAPRVVRLTTLDHLLVWIDSHHQMASDLEVSLPVALVHCNTILTP